MGPPIPSRGPRRVRTMTKGRATRTALPGGREGCFGENPTSMLWCVRRGDAITASERHRRTLSADVLTVTEVAAPDSWLSAERVGDRGAQALKSFVCFG